MWRRGKEPIFHSTNAPADVDQWKVSECLEPTSPPGTCSSSWVLSAFICTGRVRVVLYWSLPLYIQPGSAAVWTNFGRLYSFYEVFDEPLLLGGVLWYGVLYISITIMILITRVLDFIKVI